jgi:hypothetical protein
MKANVIRLWGARALIGLVFFFNVQCALVFIASPQDYASGFEIQGTPGEMLVRGMGILFLMWNIPYAVAALHPGVHFTSLLEALTMQAIGLLGETLMLVSLQGAHPALRATTLRFIVFDGSGLVALLIAVMITLKNRQGIINKPS